MAVADRSSPGADEAYLAQLGTRVRAWRERAQVTRRELAARSGLSERYLAQLEAGQGNLSILLLRQLADAMSVPVARLVEEAEYAPPEELRSAMNRLAQLPPSRLRAALALLQSRFGPGRAERVALVGLRGAGKSTLGAALAKTLNAPFIELDREVERGAGAKLGELFALYGQDGFRRFERAALARVLRDHARAVIATGGSFVTDAQSYESLRTACYTIWLKARPEEHMGRVIAQGDLRPIQGRAQAMDELHRILNERQSLYALADASIDTSGKTPRQCLAQLRTLLKSAARDTTTMETEA